MVLAAGAGRRLESLTEDLPKTLLPVDGDRTILDIALGNLRRAGMETVVVVTGFIACKVGQPRSGSAIDREEDGGVPGAKIRVAPFAQVSVQFGRQGAPRLEQQTGDVGHAGIFAGASRMVNDIDHRRAESCKRR